MMRTTIVLDHESRSAVDALARHFRCSSSEALRRAAIQLRNQVLGVPDERRRARTEALKKLFELSKGQDPDAEIAALKAEDEAA